MSVKRWDTAGTMFDIVLRGELFKAGESDDFSLGLSLIHISEPTRPY